MAKLDWEKVNRARRLDYQPSPRTLPATQRQLDYIIGLAHQKGQPKPRLPKTRKGASDRIEQLLALPAIEILAAPEPRPEPRNPTRAQTMIELRERYPALTPMTVNSMWQLFEQVDPISMLFFFDSLLDARDAPENLDDLILYIIRRFLEESVPIRADDDWLD